MGDHFALIKTWWADMHAKGSLGQGLGEGAPSGQGMLERAVFRICARESQDDSSGLLHD